jgi:hypothetical protein
MDGRAFADVAGRLSHEVTEADWRTAAGRAYYALLSEGRVALQRWGFTLPRRDQLHAFVRLRFLYAPDADLKQVGRALDELVLLRNRADYQLDKPGPFVSAAAAQQAVLKARDAIALLDRIEGDPARRAAAIAAIRTAFP